MQKERPMNFTLKDWVALAVSSVFAFFVYGNISSKAGYPRWHGLVMAIRVLNLVALIIFAYSTWPIEDELLQSEFRASGNNRGQ
jgi:EamA domain-containing membrane protein RarD